MWALSLRNVEGKAVSFRSTHEISRRFSCTNLSSVPISWWLYSESAIILLLSIESPNGFLLILALTGRFLLMCFIILFQCFFSRNLRTIFLLELPLQSIVLLFFLQLCPKSCFFGLQGLFFCFNFFFFRNSIRILLHTLLVVVSFALLFVQIGIKLDQGGSLERFTDVYHIGFLWLKIGAKKAWFGEKST